MNITGIIEAILLMADHPLTAAEIAGIIEVSEEEVLAAIEQFSDKYEGIELRQIAGGYEFATKSEYAEYISKLYEPPKLRLSPATMETLAVIAYRQPVTRAEIEHLRGVNSDKIVVTLLERGFLRECGQKSTIGKPMMYGVTDKFLKYFGMSSTNDLPPIETFMETDTAPTLPLEGYTATDE